jgi:hypothetical protein
MLRRSVIAVLSTLAIGSAGLTIGVAGASPRPLGAVPVPTDQVRLRAIGTFDSGSGNAGAEISAFDPTTKRLFVTNGAAKRIDVVDLANPAAPAKIAEFSIAPYGFDLQGVAARNGIVAVALQGLDATTGKTDPGSVLFLRGSGDVSGGLTVLTQVTVGALPDMLMFTPDGTKVLTANEGEPRCTSGTYVDPEGSVSIISLTGDSTALSATVSTVGFGGLNAATLRAQTPAVRIFGPGATAAQDLEPEYITVDPSGTTAWVTMQENNAVAVIDLGSGTVDAVVGLGTKDWSASALDTSDRDVEGVTGSGTNNRRINIVPRPIRGMYQPDAIASMVHGGQTYLFTANEGDARDWAPCINEEATGSQLTVSNAVTAGLSTLAADEDDLGRLKFTVAEPATNGGRNPYPNQTAPTAVAQDTLYSFGTRSMSVWSAQGALVWDSGSQIEEYIAATFPAWHNINNGLASDWDTRSDDKGPEPEGVAVGSAYGRTFAFLGLERAGGIMVFDVTDPTAPVIATYANPRMAGSGIGSADISPEGVQFVPADQSPNGLPLVIATHEISGTTTVFALEPVGGHRFEASPQRILDTRTSGILGAASTRTVPVPGLPAEGVAAVLVNVTATEGVGTGFVSVYGGGTWPGTSTLNHDRVGQTVANLTLVPVASDGSITVYSQPSTHLVIDLVGRFVSAATATDGRFVPVAPARLLDTRSGALRPAGATTTVAIAGQGGVPATGVGAAVVTITSTESTSPGFIAAYASGTPWPGTSTLNVDRAGQDIPNLAVVPLGSDGSISLFNQPPTHLVVDVVGYVTGTGAASGGSGLLLLTSPTRLLDTRTGSKPPAASTQVVPAGPAVALGGPALVNLTITETAARGFVTAWSGVGSRPGTSNLNAAGAEATAAAAAFVQRAPSGTTSVYVQPSAHLVVDRVGVFTA